MKRVIKDTAYGTAVYVDYLWLRLCVHPFVRGKATARPMRALDNYFPNLQCAFIHIPKAAGTTVNAELSKWSAQVAHVPQQMESREQTEVKQRLGHLSKHIKADQFRSVLGVNEWENTFSFTFVRNPWDLMVSSYFWWRQISYQGRSSVMDAALIRRMSFPAFIKSRYGEFFINEHHGSISDWFVEGDKKLVSHVARVENLQDELLYISARLSDYLGVRLSAPSGAHLHKSKRHSYQMYYDDDSKELVYKRFSGLIKEFGYRFSGGE